MGKSLNGKELGKGIVQRKDGKYSGRYTGADGNRYERVCDKLRDARAFVQLGNSEKKGYVDIAANTITVDEWFEFWMATFKSLLSPNTQRNYRERYTRNVKPYIGKMRMCDVKAMHCQKLLNRMKKDYTVSTMYQTYICMGSMFRSACVNDVIGRHPLDGVMMPQGKPKSAIRALTVKEQLAFTQAIKGKANESQFQIMLQTGLRTGEMMGLTWDCVDFEHRMITVNKQIEYRYEHGEWRAMPPKSMAGYRTIPMTTEVYEILRTLYQKRDVRKWSPLMEEYLEYYDYYTDGMKRLWMKNLVFVSRRTGEPVKNSAYDTYLEKICNQAGIKRFSMHVLRHTFATRCIERGVSVKALQRLLGHANIATTLDIYVHVSDEYLIEAMRVFEG
ncbi:MAG: site-specific integrase [Pseudobutyrivibrio sp.]|nr:site-specific integrase [Pseudobutyrivibrio sp.]